MPRHTDTRSHHDDDETRESEHRDENANDELADELDMEDAGHDAVRPPMSRDAGVFGIGLTVGLLIGAGLALLLAPQSGAATRKFLGSRARRMSHDVGDRVGGLRGDLRSAGRRSRRKVRRGVARGRWRMEELADKWR
ncbi:MAG TPA: hypothetical protein VN677_02495 [Gemmatimonadaceae bacterium]|jgi:hypothetical protein|nr:hypothetical protein [Gemmatimonadaceae bacterium]